MDTITFITILVGILIVPIVLICTGSFLYKDKDSEINYAMGYRTKMSMKSQEAWRFAQREGGKYMLSFSTLALIISIIGIFLSLFMLGIAYMAIILVCIDFICMTLAIIFTEIALKKNFDKDGKRITKK